MRGALEGFSIESKVLIYFGIGAIVAVVAAIFLFGGWNVP